MLGLVIEMQNLLIAENYERERARRISNAAFHHIHFKSIILISTDRITKIIESTLSTLNCSELKKQFIDLQILFNYLILSIIERGAFGTNVNAKKVISRILTEALDNLLYHLLLIVKINFKKMLWIIQLR